MSHLSLPLRGVFVPTHLIFHPDLPSAILVTWIQLRCLVWKGQTTSPMTIAEIAAHIGIHPTRLHRHLAHLQDISAVSLRLADHERVILSFAEEPTSVPLFQPATQSVPIPNYYHPEPDKVSAPVSYFPERILGYLSYENDDQDPLYIKDNIDGVESVHVQPAPDLSKLTLCETKEHALAAR